MFKERHKWEGTQPNLNPLGAFKFRLQSNQNTLFQLQFKKCCQFSSRTRFFTVILLGTQIKTIFLNICFVLFHFYFHFRNESYSKVRQLLSLLYSLPPPLVFIPFLFSFSYENTFKICPPSHSFLFLHILLFNSLVNYSKFFTLTQYEL